MAEHPEDLEDVIVRALSEPEFADGLRALHHRHLWLDANARYFIAKQVVKALGLERVLPGTVRRVTRPWAGLALSEEELGSVYVGDEASPPGSSE